MVSAALSNTCAILEAAPEETKFIGNSSLAVIIGRSVDELKRV